jgi:hypothetical protein
MRHIYIQDQQIECGRLHLLDDGLSILGLINSHIPDAAIDQKFQPGPDDRMVICN